MQKSRALGLAAALALAAGASAQVFNGSPAPAPIADATLTTVTFTVAGVASITDLNVTFQATHTFDGDVDAILVTPGGQYIQLSTDNGGTGDNFNVRFDQCAIPIITSLTAPGNQNYRPEGGTATGWSGTVANSLTTLAPNGALTSLDSVNGTLGDGTWTLYVYDDATGDTGSVTHAGLEFNGAADPALTFAPASGASNPVGTGTAATGAPAAVVALRVTVAPGACPTSTAHTVSVDGSLIGAGTVALLDNGVAPDTTANDNIFNGNATVGAVASGVYNLPITVTETAPNSRVGTGTTLAFTVPNPPPVNDECANALPAVVGSNAFDNRTATTSAQPVPTCQTSFNKDVWFTYTTGVNPESVSLSLCNTTLGDGVLAVYDACGGTQVACDDDSCTTPALGSTLSFCALANTTYKIRIGVFSTGAGEAGSFTMTAGAAPSTTGAASFAETCINPSATFTYRVAVTPGYCPTSTGHGVTVNTASIGGGVVTMLDDGVAPDVTAADNIFSVSLTAPASSGVYALPFTITDAQAHSDNGSGNLSVNGADETGELPGTAASITSATSVAGVLDCTGADTDMWKIEICDEANFSASTIGGATFDTQLFLFDANGVGVTFRDDTIVGTTPQSTITSANVLANGTYYVAVSGYNRDPQDATNQLHWLNTPFDTERAPDGAGAANPVASWTGTSTANAGAYTISFTGVCVPSAGCWGAPCVADFDDGSSTGTPDGGVTIDDLIYYLGLFEAGDVCADVDDGSGTNTLDGGVTIDDLIYYLGRFEAGC
jgi:subtilisin-like proprotein convertase family protein